ncbi:TonB-dependent receptor [Cytophaga aurantiaca]|uniref:TonB-dependent receptor n=1 Tax=Cytophaga aurantiaca TaxID=29530 RepID=UPI00035F4B67|nr:TonB-dependent receptor [Cytophaga aurantiaca]
MKKILFALIGVCFFFIETQAQTTKQSTNCTYQLKGIVVYANNKEPVDGAMVFVEELNNYVLTNSQGEFLLDSLCEGYYKLHIDMLLCVHKDTAIHVSGTSTLAIEIMQRMEDDAIVIEGYRVNNQPEIGSKETLEKEELARLRGTSLGESLKSIPGVSALQTGPTIFKPVIQGMYGTRVLILNNGIRQEGQQWGNEHAPEVDPFIASKITVVKGAQSIRYGSDAIGGVVLLEPEALNTFRGNKAQINVGAFSNNRAGVASAIVEHGFTKIPGLALRLQGTLRKGGNTKTPDYWLKNTGFQEANFSFAAAYQRNRWGVETFYSQFNTELGIFAGSHIGNVTDLMNAINSGQPAVTSGFSYTIERPKQIVNHELWKNKVYYTFGKNRWTIEYARQYNKREEYDSHKAYNPNLPDQPQLQFELTTHNIQSYVEHKIGRVRGVAGVSYINQSNTYEGRYFIPNFKSNAIGVYITESYKISLKTKIEAGLRYDYKTLQSYYYENNVLQSPYRIFQSPTMNVGMSNELSKHLNLQTTLGTAFRPPNVNELYSNGVHHGAAAYEIGNPDLKSEHSTNLALTLNYVFKKCFGYIHAYGYYFSNYIYLKPIFPPTLTIRGAFPTFEYTQVKATYGGFDIAFNDSLTKHLIYSTRLSLVSAYDRSQNDWLIYIPPTRWQNGMKYIFASKGKLIKPFVAVDGIWVAHKSNTPASGDYMAAPAAYFLLQAEVGAYIKVAKQDMLLTLTGQNLLNARYRDYLDRFRYYADAAGRNIIIRLQIPLDFTKH